MGKTTKRPWRGQGRARVGTIAPPAAFCAVGLSAGGQAILRKTLCFVPRLRGYSIRNLPVVERHDFLVRGTAGFGTGNGKMNFDSDLRALLKAVKASSRSPAESIRRLSQKTRFDLAGTEPAGSGECHAEKSAVRSSA